MSNLEYRYRPFNPTNEKMIDVKSKLLDSCSKLDLGSDIIGEIYNHFKTKADEKKVDSSKVPKHLAMSTYIILKEKGINPGIPKITSAFGERERKFTSSLSRYNSSNGVLEPVGSTPWGYVDSILKNYYMDDDSLKNKIYETARGYMEKYYGMGLGSGSRETAASAFIIMASEKVCENKDDLINAEKISYSSGKSRVSIRKSLNKIKDNIEASSITF